MSSFSRRHIQHHQLSKRQRGGPGRDDDNIGDLGISPITVTRFGQTFTLFPAATTDGKYLFV
jgi:hypothetical protein